MILVAGFSIFFLAFVVAVIVAVAVPKYRQTGLIVAAVSIVLGLLLTAAGVKGGL
jgi:hypothetical protein